MTISNVQFQKFGLYELQYVYYMYVCMIAVRSHFDVTITERGQIQLHKHAHLFNTDGLPLK